MMLQMLLMFLLVPGASALTNAEKSTIEAYGNVTFTENDNEPDYYTLTSEGLPDHACGQCGSNQSYSYR